MHAPPQELVSRAKWRRKAAVTIQLTALHIMRLREKAAFGHPQDDESDYHQDLQVSDIEHEADIPEWEQEEDHEESTSLDFDVNEPDDDPLGLGMMYDM